MKVFYGMDIVERGGFSLCVFLFLPLLGWAQNLVLNPGFEQHIRLPDGAGQWYLAEGWTNAEGGHTWPSPTPDYLHRSANGQGQLPDTPFGTITPQDGDAVMGAMLWSPRHPDFREYLTQNLIKPLEVGTTYTCSFFVSNGKQGPGTAGGCGISGLGVFFSEEAPVQTGGNPLEAAPQFVVPEVLYSPDWQQIRFTFVADKPYRFLTVGNFEDDGRTFVRRFSNTTFPAAYSFFDSFELEEYHPDEPEPEALPPAAPDTAAMVIFRETDIGTEPSCPVYIPSIFSPDGNGVNDFFEVHTPCVLLALHIQIFDRPGRLVFTSDDPKFRWDGYYNGKHLGNGMYFYVIEAIFPDEGGTRKEIWRGRVIIP